jgi:O-antigen/teichoic acid export membrane protein
MEEYSFSYKTLRNSVYLFANFLLPMTFTVFVTRALALKLGSAEYGVYLLVNAISAFVNFVDLGLSTAVTKYTAEYQGSGNKQGMTELLSSARLLFLITGLVGMAVFAALGRWFLPFFHIPISTQHNIFIVFLLAGGVFFVNSLITIYSAALSALQRFDLLTKLNLAGLTVTSLGIILLLDNHFQLKAIMGLNIVIAGVVLLIFHYYVRKLLPEIRLSFTISWKELKKAYTFGILAFSSNLAASCLIYLDRLIIPIFLGPAALPFYSVPGNVALKTSVVTNTFGQMLFPMASGLAGAGETERLKNVYVRAFRNLHVVSAAVTVAIILFANKILLFWLGQEYADKSTGLLIILAVTYFFVALYIPLQGMLLGLGQLKFLIKQSMLMAAINLILLLILVPRYGITGAAWAYLVSVLPMFYAFYWAEHTQFGLRNGQFRRYMLLYLKLGVTALVSGILIRLLLVGLVNNVAELVIIGPCSVLLYFVVHYFLGFMDADDVYLIKSFILKFLKIKSPS